MNKVEARRIIIEKVNEFRLQKSRERGNIFPIPFLGSRQIQLAVHIARRNELVDNFTLRAAKFNEV